MEIKDLVSLRLHNEHLLGDLFSWPEEVVKWFGAVQSQDYSGAKWAIAQRTKNATSASIDELFNEGKILRTHLMRPTWHFVTPTDIGWMLELTKHRVKALMGHYNRKLELDEALFKKTGAIFVTALQDKKNLTRQELKLYLTKVGIKTDVQRLAHIVMWAELDGLICSGPLRGKNFTYVLFKERVPKTTSFSQEEALTEITKRYFTSHGPATLQDCAWWSGLTTVDVKRGIEMNASHLTYEVIDGKKFWFVSSAKNVKFTPPLVQLLPNYDEYLVAYKGYGNIFTSLLAQKDPKFTSLLSHIVVIDGKVVGGWKRTFEKKTAIITLRILRKLRSEESAALQSEAEKFGRFLHMPVEIRD